MNASYMKYTAILSDISDKIINVSQKLISANNIKTREAVETAYREYVETVIQYKGFIKGLTEITPPKIIQKEHREIINAFQIFNEGTDIVSQALDIKNLTIDKEKMKLGKDMLEQGEKRINQLA